MSTSELLLFQRLTVSIERDCRVSRFQRKRGFHLFSCFVFFNFHDLIRIPDSRFSTRDSYDFIDRFLGISPAAL